ncbi:hypothetical protein A0H81_04328 [Grifola frondosa]|uniref:Uncharacterized protein n=1 Tax=Grifola frondosa TaxID=5627 RepID=A0A1C7MGP2_GRIFR|nr:hypothetical protein A0H81_04328 [Grifola frondosa]
MAPRASLVNVIINHNITEDTWLKHGSRHRVALRRWNWAKGTTDASSLDAHLPSPLCLRNVPGSSAGAAGGGRVPPAGQPRAGHALHPPQPPRDVRLPLLPAGDTGSNVQSALLSTQLSNIREYNSLGPSGVQPRTSPAYPIVNVQPLEEAAATDPPAPGSPLRSIPKIRLQLLLAALQIVHSRRCASRGTSSWRITRLRFGGRVRQDYSSASLIMLSVKRPAHPRPCPAAPCPVTESVATSALTGQAHAGPEGAPERVESSVQREFLACLAEVVRANKVPSTEFVFAVEATMEGIRRTMGDSNWYAFGRRIWSGI